MDTYQGKIVLVNLIDRKKEGTDQRLIGELFHKSFKDSGYNNRLDFTWFDFHEECKKMKYENISKLLKTSSASSGLQKFGFTNITLKNDFSFDKIDQDSFNVESLQDGLFRTNCMDCLDRTNVVQSVIARQILHKILYKFGYEGVPTEEVFQEFQSDFEKKYKEVWADNGDFLSISYTGTQAMKGDFTRIGKKTKKGTLIDGKLACTRYYMNAFCDGYNQDCHDLFLGKLIL